MINTKLFKNISALSLLQFMNYVFPFITIPYVVRTLGVEKFGLVSFAAAFTAYFSMLIDYGFNFSATRSISIHRDNIAKESQIITSVYLIKFVLFIVSILAFVLIVLNVGFFKNESDLYIYSFLTVIGALLTPLWYFQGVEKMIIITGLTFAVRLILVFSIFSFITNKGDYKLYALLNSFSSITIGLISFSFVIMKISLLTKKNFPILLSEFKEGSILFVSNLSINLYTVSNTFILGLFAPPVIVGYWSAADKIRLAMQNILTPISQGFYPHLSKLFNNSFEAAMLFVRKTSGTLILLSFTVSFMLFAFAEPLVLFILGADFYSSAYILKIISFLPFIIILSNITGIQILLNINGSKEFTNVVLLAAMLNIMLSFILVPKLMAIGTAISVVITEIIVTSMMFYFSFKRIKKAGGKLEV